MTKKSVRKVNPVKWERWVLIFDGEPFRLTFLTRDNARWYKSRVLAKGATGPIRVTITPDE